MPLAVDGPRLVKSVGLVWSVMVALCVPDC
jgi:hypothetical protein